MYTIKLIDIDKKGFLWLLLILIISFSTVVAQDNENIKNGLDIPEFKQEPVRIPKYHLKTKRMIYTDEHLAIAQKNISQYPKAQQLKNDIIKAAEQWLNWNDEDFRVLLSDARVPRSFDLNANGCPRHGDKVFKKGGHYPWILDTAHPFQVKCPVGGEVYPSNDYESYYKSNFKEKKGWDTEYVDNGWGWVAPDGERYWFVAYANHWLWHKLINPGILNLSRAYLLTGDKQYAHKAAVMLYRLAEVYPSMDYANQSRYGLMSKKENRVYNGKVVNLIWETGFIKNAAHAYDAIWESIDEDVELQRLYNKNGKEIRSFIEANLLEEALDAYFERKIQGNFGMHQSALLSILFAREKMDTEKYIDLIVNEPGHSQAHTGLRYALYNQIFRDGLALESPGYNLIWVYRFAELSELLRRSNINLFEDPRVKNLLDGPINIVASGKYTVDWGDTGSAIGSVAGRDPDTYQIAYNMYNDTKYLEWLASIDVTGDNTFASFESLFRKALPETQALPDKRAVAVQPSRLFAGYGLGILNNKRDETTVAFTYGMHFSHYHWDFLNFELFANGQKMMPDLGYPDAMNRYVPGIYTWSKNTVAHNTVVVDEQKQDQNLPGVLHDFVDGNFVRAMDASSPAYSQTNQYRRNLIMVDVDDKQSYIVDYFRVSGGKQHDYSLHGPPGTVSTLEGAWGEKVSGTLAGPNIEVGEMYDDAKLGAKDYTGGYATYRGSGFQHLFNVQQFESGQSILQYEHTRDENAKLRIHLLPQEPQQVYMADAFDKPRAKTHRIKYLIARRNSEKGQEELKSNFVSVLEPFNTDAYIQSTRLLTLREGDGSVVEVTIDGSKDIIISDTKNSVKDLVQYPLQTDANSAVVTIGANGKLKRVFFSNGTYLSYRGQKFEAEAIKGVVTHINPKEQKIKIEIKEDDSLPDDNISNSVAYFSNEYRTTAHPLGPAKRNGKYLNIKTKDALLVGIIRIKDANEKTVTTATYLPFASLYKGVTLLDENLEQIGKLEKVERGKLTLAEKPSTILTPGDNLWFSNIGVGDTMEVRPVFSWASTTDL